MTLNLILYTSVRYTWNTIHVCSCIFGRFSFFLPVRSVCVLKIQFRRRIFFSKCVPIAHIQTRIGRKHERSPILWCVCVSRFVCLTACEKDIFYLRAVVLMCLPWRVEGGFCPKPLEWNAPHGILDSNSSHENLEKRSHTIPCIHCEQVLCLAHR